MNYERGKRRAFATIIKKRMLYFGCELKQQLNDRYIIMTQLDEDVYIPIRKSDWIMIFYVKDGCIVTTYEAPCSESYSRDVFKFLKWHQIRNLSKVFQSDNETRTYI